jgi:hypothetical protein
VIVIMSDHGSGRGLHLDDQTGSDVTERSANFFAAYTPGHDRLFAPDVTPVNLFPTLFDAYLGIGYEPRPNTTWVNVGTEFRPAELAGSAPLVDPPGQLNGVSR